MPRRVQVIIAVGVSLVAGAVAWWRIPGADRDVFWAEDGRTFLGDATQGTSPFQPYGGYLHLVPRLEGALILHTTPVAGWALTMTAVNCLLAGLVAGAVFLLAGRAVPWVPARIVVALLTVATPIVVREVLGNAANVHSVLLWLVFWIALWIPRSSKASLAVAPLVLIAVLSEVQCVFLLPLLLRRVRDRNALPHRIALVAGVATQLTIAFAVGRTPDPHPAVAAVSIPIGWVLNAVVSTFAPVSTIHSPTAGLGAGVLLLVLVPIGAAAYAIVRGTVTQRWTAAALVGLSLVVWWGGVLVTPAPWLDYATATGTPWLSRYGAIPAMSLLATVPLALAVLRERSRDARSLVAGIAGLALIGIVLLAQAPTTYTRRTGGPNWSSQIPAAEATCAAGASVVELNETLTWKVRVPCSALAAARA